MKYRRALFITVATVLIVFLASIPAQSADVGCATVTIKDGKTVTETKDPGVGVAIVGHYLWIQYAYQPSSLDNIFSVDIDGVAAITVCTDFVVSGVVPQGTGTGATVTVGDPSSSAVMVVPHSTLSPHPQLVDAWITENGFVIR